ncbi:hypothetical protein L204_101337 [Cryptococcus depauperatus]
MQLQAHQLALSSPHHEYWMCNKWWDGQDFTACFRDRYLANYALFLVALSAVWFASVTTYVYFATPHSPVSISTQSTLISPQFSSLESSVILDCLSSSLFSHCFPTTDPSSAGTSRREERAEILILEWRNERTRREERLSNVQYWIGLIGGFAWFAVEAIRAVEEGRWISLIFPAWITVLVAISKSIIPLVSMHIPVALLLIRSSILHQNQTPISITCVAIEFVYWLTHISIPYQETLGELLQGGTSKGGSYFDNSDHGSPKHCEEPASPISRATYFFLLPLLLKNYFKPITSSQIPCLREDDSSAAALGAFRVYQAKKDISFFRKHNENRKRELGSDLVGHFCGNLFTQACWSILLVFFEYLPTIGLRLLLRHIENRATSPRSNTSAALFVAMMAAGQTLAAMVDGQCCGLGRRLAVRLRGIIVSEVFSKALRREDITSDGRISNFVSADANALSELCALSFYIFSSPLSIIVNAFLLYSTLGYASWAGIGILCSMLGIQYWIQEVYGRCHARFMTASDKRIEGAKEIIAYIKLIKFNAWESRFLRRMGETRRQELKALTQRFTITVLNQLVSLATPVFVTGVAFAVHSLVFGKPLSTDTAFASLVLFNKMRYPLGLLQTLWTRLIQGRESCIRIQRYLDEPDTDKFTQISTPGSDDPQIGFSQAILTYATNGEIEASSEDKSLDIFALGQLNINFPIGKLSIICGPIGSGKTTLLLGLLGEAPLFHGKVFLPSNPVNRASCPTDQCSNLSDTVSYCAQSPWLIGASIRENILFGTPMEPVRYEQVISACALEKDLEAFQDGDDTEVGEKGTTCSGGQKARIALARAIYSSAKTVILDDVLSAVDTQTSKHIYDNVFKGNLVKGRTVILVTHQVNLVARGTEMIVMLQDGTVVGQGSPMELMKEGLLDLREEDIDTEVDEADTPSSIATVSTRGTTLVDDNSPAIVTNLKKSDTILAIHPHNANTLKTLCPFDDKINKVIRQSHKLVEIESHNSGATSVTTYMLYIKAMGVWVFMILLFFFITSNGLQVASNAWIKKWANNSYCARSALSSTVNFTQLSISQVVTQPRSVVYYLLIYWLISVVYLVTIACRTGAALFGALAASNKLYCRLLNRLMNAKMRFYDSNPSGRIMNRLTKDISTIDQETGEIFLYFLEACLSSATVLVVILIFTPAFFVPLCLIIAVYWLLGSLYVSTNREIKRIESVTRSPILINFEEVMGGMSTIRSYGDSARFLKKFFHVLDQNTRSYWYLWQVNSFFDIWCRILGAFVTVFAAVFALGARNMSAGAAGLSISYALTFTDNVLWIVKMYANTEMVMNSVERIGEYLNLEEEEEDDKKFIKPPAHWPSRDGSIVVDSLTCTYAPGLEPVLEGISFEIGPREKIGICGRTGSGKSTLALSFFRLLHQSGGKILIDGQDIAQLSLSTLRSRLTILPQEAQLFSGTIRDNLDPFDQHDDAEIWEALSQCGLVSHSRRSSRSVSRRQSKFSLPTGQKETLIKVVRKHPSARSLLKMASKRLEVLQDNDDEEKEEITVIKSLDELVTSGGQNFSQGQRQLLALARGLLKLKSSSFLIMDESTANLDQETDATIQEVLRERLGDIQMLVIAHRLMTVCGLDKVLVLDQGRIAEFGTPWDLINKRDGAFRELCKQSGDEKELRLLAKSIHDAKFNPMQTTNSKE